jgi:hypothetical protein
MDCRIRILNFAENKASGQGKPALGGFSVKKANFWKDFGSGLEKASES